MTETRVPFVDLGAEYRSHKQSIDEAIAGVLQRTDFVLGGAVGGFERDYAAFCEVSHAIGVDSGYSALELTLRACGVGPGDEVVTAANTFIATALAITSCGARPVFVDVDPATCNIDPRKLAEALTSRTRVIIPVHLYGHPADMDPILQLAEQKKLQVVVDGCQAHGARYKGRSIGALGHAVTFSFYPSKNLGAYGDGGMVVTDDVELADRVRSLRNLGLGSTKFVHEIKGYNHRLDTLQAAVLQVKLPHLDRRNAARRRAAGLYSELLGKLPLSVPQVADWAEPVFHLYVIRTEQREALRAHLSENGIASGLHYPVPCHLQPAFSELGHQRGDFPVTEAYADRLLSLPMYPEIDDQAVRLVADVIRDFVERGQDGDDRLPQEQTLSLR